MILRRFAAFAILDAVFQYMHVLHFVFTQYLQSIYFHFLPVLVLLILISFQYPMLHVLIQLYQQ